MKVREIMTGWPEFVFPETEIVDAAKLMCHLEIGALPVCDRDRLVGIVTDRDIVVRYVAEGGHTQLVGSIMTPNPCTIGPDEPIERAEALMAEHRVRRLPVCEGGNLVGIVSQADVARHASREEVGALVAAISRP